MTKRTGTIAALTLVAGLGLYLRLRGITFGLPAVYNPDEIAIMSRALAFAKGDLNPHNFLYPTLFFYALFGWIGAYFVLGRLTGAFASLAAFERQFFVDPSGIYLAGRLLGVACGVLTIVALYVLGRRLFGRAAGLSAAALLAVAPFAVRDAHYVKHDVPVTLLIVLAHVAYVRTRPDATSVRAEPVEARTADVRPSTSSGRTVNGALIANATLTGLACSTHYYAVFLVLPLLWTLWVAAGGRVDRFLRSALAAGAVAAAAFFIASPFLLVEPGRALGDIVANREIVVDRAVAGSSGLFASATAYARMLVVEAVGWPVLAAAVAGVAILTAATLKGRTTHEDGRTTHRLVLLLAFPLPFLAFISNTIAAGRYLNPVLPFIALFAAVAIVHVSRMLGSKAAPIAMVALTFIAAAPGLMMSMRTGSFFRQTDTRTLAQRFIETAIAPGSTIALQPYSTPLRPSRESLLEGLAAHGLSDPARVPAKFSRQLALDPYPAPAYRLVHIGDGGLDEEKIYVTYGELGGTHGLAALRRRSVQYVVVKRYNRPDPDTEPFFDALASEGTRLAVFSPFRPDVPDVERAPIEPYLHNTDTPLSDALERPGPVIEIWKLL